ncbi:MAG TPA: hypothetical protein PKW21_04965 [Rhabdaerophilum sp.]|nr:hypothetical protein [Rhabdaerophilum sp.]
MRCSRFALPILALLVAMPTAQAFNCYIPERPESPAALHEKPDPKSKVIARMAPGGMIKQVRNSPDRNGWVHVQWNPRSEDKSKPKRGWVVLDHVYGGECED